MLPTLSSKQKKSFPVQTWAIAHKNTLTVHKHNVQGM